MRQSALLRSCALVLVVLVVCVTKSFSQNGAEHEPDTKTTPASQTARVLYSGKLLGYARLPDLQSGKAVAGCPSRTDASPSAKAFLDLRAKYKDAVLVGTGDNFAPELGARVFSPAPADPQRQVGEYAPLNKEMYYWDEEGKDQKARWVSLVELQDRTKKKDFDLLNRIFDGRGTIPTDNVGCFLAAAGYAAVVPGKLDFYFGPARLRQMARFLASIDTARNPGFNPVQMLAANLVVRTDWIKPPDRRHPKLGYFAGMPKELGVNNVKDGNRVYPWFQGPRIGVVDLGKTEGGRKLLKYLNEQTFEDKDLRSHLEDREKAIRPQDAEEADTAAQARERLDSITGRNLTLCEAELGNPTSIPEANCSIKLDKKIPRLRGSQIEIEFQFPSPANRGKLEQFSTVVPGRSYGVCLNESAADAKIAESAEGRYCLRFGVHIPFFADPEEVLGGTRVTRNYKEPSPLAFVPKTETRPYDVAIFAAVDTSLREYVGSLNFAFKNSDAAYETTLVVEDPGEALRQQLDYFEQMYQLDHKEKFHGLKILLAQMSPQRARALATKLPDFQIVVTAADEDQIPDDNKLKLEWTLKGDSMRKPPAFLAVPRPFFDTRKQESIVRLGLIDVDSETSGKWVVSSEHFETTEGLPPGKSLAPQFWARVASALPQCLPRDFKRPAKDSTEDNMKWLTLCAMRERTGADVALIQKRDLFPSLPAAAGDGDENAQQILDRIIWKGDFLTLLYVPGSALLKALEKSDRFDAEDSATLSLPEERLRGLLRLGARWDAKRSEYVINEVALDPARLYAVATTDYIGSGDTGYPELTAAAIDPPKRPADFPDKLELISSVVCRSLFQETDAKNFCRGVIKRDSYFDESKQRPMDWLKSYQASASAPAKTQQPREPAKPTDQAVQERVEQRAIWSVSLEKLGLSFSALDNNLSDADIDSKFGGLTTSPVLAHHTSTWASDLRVRVSLSTSSREFFIAPSVAYNVQRSGISNAPRQVSQIANLASLDFGVVFRAPSRALPHLDGIVSAHFETQTAKPFTTFFLGTKTLVDPVNNITNDDRKEFYQDRSRSFLPRLGVRLQSRAGSLEVGGQVGKEYNAVAGYRFTSPDGSVVEECLPNPIETFAGCVKKRSTPPNATITNESEASVIRETRNRAGLYWKINLTIPFSSRLSYVASDEGDLFARFSRDNATDTRFRDFSKHQLKFFIWPSFAIGPAFRLFLYENKVNGDFLVQRQFMFEADFRFDLFNKRRPDAQVRYGRPGKGQ